MDILQILISIGGAVGISSIITSAMTKRKEIEFKVREMKERRYKSTLLYMDAYFEPKNIKYISSRQPDVENADDILEYLKMEYHEMILYASHDVVLAVKQFIENPSTDTFLATVVAMRNDAWNPQNDLDVSDIKIKAPK